MDQTLYTRIVDFSASSVDSPKHIQVGGAPAFLFVNDCTELFEKMILGGREWWDGSHSFLSS
jgi:hypothetical protein